MLKIMLLLLLFGVECEELVDVPVKTDPAVLLLSPHPAFVENAGVASHPRWPEDNRTNRQTNSRDGGRALMSMLQLLREFSQRFTFAAKSFFALLYSSTALCRRDRRMSILCRTHTHLKGSLIRSENH